MKVRRAKKARPQRKSLSDNWAIIGETGVPGCRRDFRHDVDHDDRWHRIMMVIAFVGLVFMFAAWLCRD